MLCSVWISGLVTAQQMPKLPTAQQQSRTQPIHLHAAEQWYIFSHHRKCSIFFWALGRSRSIDLADSGAISLHAHCRAVCCRKFASCSPCAQIVQLSWGKSTTVLESKHGQEESESQQSAPCAEPTFLGLSLFQLYHFKAFRLQP